MQRPVAQEWQSTGYHSHCAIQSIQKLAGSYSHGYLCKHSSACTCTVYCMARRLETRDRRGFSTTHATSPPPPAATNAWQHRGVGGGVRLVRPGHRKEHSVQPGPLPGERSGRHMFRGRHPSLFFFDGAGELAAHHARPACPKSYAADCRSMRLPLLTELECMQGTPLYQHMWDAGKVFEGSTRSAANKPRFIPWYLPKGDHHSHRFGSRPRRRRRGGGVCARAWVWGCGCACECVGVPLRECGCVGVGALTRDSLSRRRGGTPTAPPPTLAGVS